MLLFSVSRAPCYMHFSVHDIVQVNMNKTLVFTLTIGR